MRAMVLGAGLGTRLRPLTDELPKPAVPIANVPLAVIAVRRLAAVGVTDVVVNAHHLPDVLEQTLSDHPTPGVDVVVVREPSLLGTGGGVRAALEAQARLLGPPLDDEPIVLFNGDILFAPDLDAAIAEHRALEALATMVVREDPRAEKLGPIEIDGEGRVRRILGAPGARDAALRVCMFTGVHVLSGRAVTQLPAEGCIIRKGYAPWLAGGEVVAGHVETAPFRDCGTPGELLAAMGDALSGRIPIPGLQPTENAIDGTAEIAGARITGSSIGANVRIARGVELEGCLVLPGTEVRESARSAILSRRHRIFA
jgi:mannose-1-phosphate guanylyltransferase